MNELLPQLQERYLREFAEQVPIGDFLINVLVVALLAALLREFYIRYGNALANRRTFANNFLPLALGTLLIIMIVKSSIALSLGLVGALSIVRFRAAIKEPEELTYLFLVIGIGLAGGANQPVLAIVAFVVIIGLLWLGKVVSGRKPDLDKQLMYLHITTDKDDIIQITSTLNSIFPYLELKRMDTRLDGPGLDLSFRCRADHIGQIDRAKNALQKLSPNMHISLIDQPQLLG